MCSGMKLTCLHALLKSEMQRWETADDSVMHSLARFMLTVHTGTLSQICVAKLSRQFGQLIIGEWSYYKVYYVVPDL